MIRLKNLAGVFLIFSMLSVFSGCGKTPQAQAKLTISAAASLTDVMNEIKNEYSKDVPNVSITYNFGSSGSLQQQIENGAEVDLFISAAQKQMDALKEKGLLEEGTRKDLIGNTLVLIVPNNNSLPVNFQELAQDKGKKIAMGEPKSVPAGQYAQEVLNKLNIGTKIKSKIVYAKDVRTVLSWVETGEAYAGIVYRTDAKVSQKVKIAAEAPEGSHAPILYPASVIKSSKNTEAAKSFLNFLSGEKSKTIFKKYGFKL